MEPNKITISFQGKIPFHTLRCLSSITLCFSTTEDAGLTKVEATSSGDKDFWEWFCGMYSCRLQEFKEGAA